LSRRFVSIVGPGGIGKTAVALAIEQALRREFADRVYLVDLGSLSDTSDVGRAVASALGCLGHGRDPESCIRSCVIDEPILVVLDNCEHVIEAAASFAERLFGVLPTAHVLTTSRERLRVEGETVHLLAPLDTPLDEVPSAQEALTSPAVQLFMDRAASGGHTAPLGDADAPVVSRACRRLDGIPLAIELVASRVGSFGIQGTADLIVNGAELLLRGRRGGVARHQTLQAMLDWSFRLLSVDEGRILCRLSTLPGSFTLKDAVCAAGDSQATQQSLGRVIASLVDKSLVHASAEEGGTRYRLLATTRAYAMAKLTESRNAAS
jgi:predicted ATPase